MPVQLLTHIELPAHRSNGGFDHADIHSPSDRLYVAHPSNDSIDMIDCASDQYIHSVHGFTAVAGALVSEECNLVFTSNRGENTVSVFAPGDEQQAHKIGVGVKPNGLAFDPAHKILIAANVGDPSVADSYSVWVAPQLAWRHSLVFGRQTLYLIEIAGALGGYVSILSELPC